MRVNAASPRADGALRLPILAAFAAPTLPLAAIIFPSFAILPGFYASHTGIPLATIGAILIVARLFDVAVDPIIGFLSDGTRSRWGSRKPWILAGSLLLSVASVHLYGPAPTVSTVYYAGWFLAFYLGYSLIEIPHKAWGTELARGYEQRASIASSFAVAFALGNLAFAAAPLVFFGNSAGYNAKVLATIGWIVAITLPLCALVAISVVGRGTAPMEPSVRIPGVTRDMFRNAPLLRFLTIFLFTGLGQGIFYGLVFLFVGSVLRLGEMFAWILLSDALVTLLCIPVWYRLVVRLEKHRAWALGLVISAAAILAMWWLPTGDSGFVPLILLVCVRAFGAGVINVAPNALLGDVVDYELFKRGANRAANFHALVSIATKATATIGSGAGLLLIGLAGFEAKGDNTAGAIFVFDVVTLGLPAIVLIAGAAVAIGFPLDRARHETIRRRLGERTV